MDCKDIVYPFAYTPVKTIYYPNGKQTCSVIRRTTEGKLWESRISKSIWNDCKKGTMTIDIGSNLGCHSLSMLDKVGRNGNVLAIEPQRNTAECLKKTLDKYTNAEIGEYLVSNKKDIKQFKSDGTGRSRIPINGQKFAENVSSIELPSYTLDEIVLSNKKNISLIKIDVEGHEFEVLEGSKKTIDKHRPIIYIEVWNNPCSKKMLKLWCDENNYNINVLGVNDYRLYPV